MWIFSGFWFFVCLFFVFSEKVIYYGFSECTKLVSCAYYVGGSFYIILWMLYKNWGVYMGIEYFYFFNVSYFLFVLFCLFRCVRLLCSYTLHLKLYFKDGGVCFGAYSTPYKCRLNLHHFSC